MMDEFGLYPRDEAFDPLGVMLFKALQVIAFLFFIALLAISPESKDDKIDSNAEFIITMDWPDNHPDDIDLFVQDPAGNIAWYRHREAGFLTLDRDDRGGVNDFITVNGKKTALKGLTNRRKAEREQFLSKAIADIPAPSFDLNPKPAASTKDTTNWLAALANLFSTFLKGRKS